MARNQKKQHELYIPEYGARPLVQLFLFNRFLQVLAMIAVVGITATCVSEVDESQVHPPSEIIAALVVACISLFYTIVSVVMFYGHMEKSLTRFGVGDFFALVAFVVVAVELGQPVSIIDCMEYGNASQAITAYNATNLTTALDKAFVRYGRFSGWTTLTQANCFEVKGVWGLSIAMCILFSCTAFTLPTLRHKQKRAAAKGQSEPEDE